MKQISVIVPTLNEAAIIEAALARLQPLRARGHEVIVADGESRDATAALARPLADRVIAVPRGRARQMNGAAGEARGDVLLFLHADTLLPDGADRLVLEGLRAAGRSWGRFDVRIEGLHPLLRATALAMNWRSHFTAVCTGDQCLFVLRDVFVRVGGYPDIALMEDIALCKRLRRCGRPLRIRAPALTSARRWEAGGIGRTIGLMWWLRLRYFLGASPARLLRVYERGRNPWPPSANEERERRIDYG